ncbi:uncharacterized protein LOC113240286 [Hyposmocoma kahamanoa]|uniref:uncharacterized protein LOC113240286 n=1 Tax=Hyposmocoma kahamanoa TaxID=1477025 RepID=UPI000E6D8386|nr:uncharacterized protein LOC113240286 [Hyposmocoma kahamanoa]
MDSILRTVIIAQRNIELEEPYLIINENISPKLNEFLRSMENIKFEDGVYHTYYGGLKVIVNNFLVYWSAVINECFKDVDALSNRITKDELLELIDRSISIHENKHEEFVKCFFPVENPEDLDLFEDLENKYEIFQQGMATCRQEVVHYERQEQLDQFVIKNSELGARKKNEVFECAHTIMALCMAENLAKIRASLIEIRNRIQQNLCKLCDNHDNALSGMLDELYDKNKEKILITRQEHKLSVEEAEINNTIKNLRVKIEEHQIVNKSLHHIEDELKYWEKRLSEFEKIEHTILKLRAELRNTEEYEKTFKEMSDPKQRGTRRDCWAIMAENIKNRKEIINEKLVEASKALITFFAVRGQNRILYKDDIGSYIIDDFGHQVYLFDHGSDLRHVTCDGTFRQVKETDKYYFDVYGRYVFNEHGKKVYQCGPCTSTYDLGFDDLFVKTTLDCGHSEAKNPHCRMQFRDPMDIEVLPSVEPVDIRKSLPSEVVKYLWDNLSHILPDALYETGEKQPKNPIHLLSHSILRNKYTRTNEQLGQKRAEAMKYYNDIYTNRKEKAVIYYKAWKEKQVKPRKPEEFDDAESRAVYDAYVAHQHFTNWSSERDEREVNRARNELEVSNEGDEQSVVRGELKVTSEGDEFEVSRERNELEVSRELDDLEIYKKRNELEVSSEHDEPEVSSEGDKHEVPKY